MFVKLDLLSKMIIVKYSNIYSNIKYNLLILLLTHKQLNILFEEHFVRSMGKGKGGGGHMFQPTMLISF